MKIEGQKHACKGCFQEIYFSQDGLCQSCTKGLIKFEPSVIVPLTADTLLPPSLRDGKTYRYTEK